MARVWTLSVSGMVRYGIQAFLMVIALNLKRIVQLLTGVYFRSPSRKRVTVAAQLAGVLARLEIPVRHLN